MALCKFSNTLTLKNQTVIDNIFFNEHLPKAPAECVKVYLYGYYKSSNSSSSDNTLESFSKVLSLSVEDIKSAFLYWQEKNLVQIIGEEPFEVIYLDIKKSIASESKKYSNKKYKKFNTQLQEIVLGRMITPTEYMSYYSLIEDYGLEQEALIMIIKYASTIKGSDINYKYIISVAKSWIAEGITSSKQVDEKIMQLEKSTGNVKQVLNTIGIKRAANKNEKELYLKWVKDMDFSQEVILYVAKKASSFQVLNFKLEEYNNIGVKSIKEISSYENEKKFKLEVAKQITKNLGKFYENVSNVIDTYIDEWLRKGYSDETLVQISQYCFKNNINSLGGMNNVIDKFYKLGLVSIDAINNHIDELIIKDQHIKTIIEMLDLNRRVIQSDRLYYKTWTKNWGFKDAIIKYAAEISKNTDNPFKYINKILSNWKESGVKTVAAAKKTAPKIKPSQKTTTQKKTNFKKRSYSDEELNSLFENLNKVDVE